MIMTDMLGGTMKKKSTVRVLCCLLMVFTTTPILFTQQATALKDIALGRSELSDAILLFTQDWSSLERNFGFRILPARRERLQKLCAQWLDNLEKTDFNKLSVDGRVDFILFRNHLQRQSRDLQFQEKLFTEVEPLLPFARTLLALAEAQRRMEWVEANKTAALLNDFASQTKELQKQLANDQKTGTKRKELPNRTMADRAFSLCNQLRQVLKDWFEFYNGYDPLFTWWVAEPYKDLEQALQNYAAFLRQQLVGAAAEDDTVIVGDPIGREALLADLAAEMIPYSPEELIAIGQQELAWCEQEMLKTSQQLGYGAEWHKALEHVKNLYVDPGKQPEMIRGLALEATAFLEKNNLLTIPPLAKENWHIEMLTPQQQLVNPFFTGGDVIDISYPTQTMTHERKLMSLRGNNPHFSRATVHHELIPGHHLQGFMAERYRAYRGLFNTAFYLEGWPLYWEMLFWDMSYARSAEDRVGMLFWRMHRCARIIFSLSFHMGKMTPDECIDFLIKRVGHERENAIAEVRRSLNGSYEPLYQCAYMLGGLQLRALARELTASGRMTLKVFHDAVLQENSMPIALLRAKLLGLPLDRNFKNDWNFYPLKIKK
jgi:uncharacterized protein (DUF885 family)